MKESMAELICEWQDVNKAHHYEGEHGVRNFVRLVHTMGYVDSLYFGQFQGASYGDLIHFLEDNPGAVDAIVQWISDQNVDEWKENLLSGLPTSEEDEDESEDGEPEEEILNG